MIWHNAIDRHKFVGADFLDLAKVFDCVNHSILLDKLTHYDVVGDAHAWSESYLCGQQQSVKFNGSLSKWGSVGVGVLQGSLLGPLLFSILILWMIWQLLWAILRLICMLMTQSYIVVVRTYNVFRMTSSLIFIKCKVGCRLLDCIQ